MRRTQRWHCQCGAEYELYLESSAFVEAPPQADRQSGTHEGSFPIFGPDPRAVPPAYVWPLVQELYAALDAARPIMRTNGYSDIIKQADKALERGKKELKR